MYNILIIVLNLYYNQTEFVKILYDFLKCSRIVEINTNAKKKAEIKQKKCKKCQGCKKKQKKNIEKKAKKIAKIQKNSKKFF